MPLDLTNPDVIKFLVESYEKTARLRMKWNTLNAERLKQAATLTRPDKFYTTYDVFKAGMVGGLPAITRDHITAARNRRRIPIRDGTFIPGVAHMKKGHSIVDVGLGDPKEDPRLGRSDTDTATDPIMRVVAPEHKKILYKEIPFYGRKVYLKNRSRLPPEKRYYFNECTSWDYGWRGKDSVFSSHRPSCGRVWRLTRDVTSRTGPHPDPHYYKNPEIPNVNKCPK